MSGFSFPTGYVKSAIAVGAAVALVTATAKTVTSISLPPGIWDITGDVYFSTGGTTTVSAVQAGISLTTNTFAATPDDTQGHTSWFVAVANAISGGSPSLATGVFRQTLLVQTTVFLIASSNFGTSTQAAYGDIRATRVE